MSIYQCGQCRQEVELHDRRCPWCGALFVRLLHNAGHQGHEASPA